jgi:hypothetical protein
MLRSSRSMFPDRGLVLPFEVVRQQFMESAVVIAEQSDLTLNLGPLLPSMVVAEHAELGPKVDVDVRYL